MHCRLSQQISGHKKAKDLSADNVILACIIIFSENHLPKKIMSDTGGNFVSDKFKQFYKNLNTGQAISTSYYHQSNEQVVAFIKFIKCTIKNALILKQTFILLYCR